MRLFSIFSTDLIGALHGLGLLVTVPWLFWRHYWTGGGIALFGGLGVLLVFIHSFYRTGKRLDALRARRARLCRAQAER